MSLIGIYLLIGTFTGLLTGLLGGGSGPILIPILTALLIYQDVPSDLVMHQAVGTALGIAVLAMLASMHIQRKHLSEVKGIVVQLLPGGIIGAVIGTLLAGYLASYVFKILFGLAVIGIAFYMIFDYRFTSTKTLLPNKMKFFAISIPMSIIASCFGVGLGPIYVPMLKKYGFSMSTSIAIATFVGGVIVLFAALGFIIMGYHQTNLPTYSFGYIYLPILAGIGIPSIISARIGAKFTHVFSPKTLKILFTSFLILIGVKMIV